MNISGPDEAMDATLYNMNFGLFQKNSLPLPTDGVVFLTPPPSHLNFLKHKNPHLSGYPTQKTAPPGWISRKKNIRLKLNLIILNRKSLQSVQKMSTKINVEMTTPEEFVMFNPHPHPLLPVFPESLTPVP